LSATIARLRLGDESYSYLSDAPTAANFSSAGGGYEHSCALRLNGKIACWGSDNYNQLSDKPGGTFRDLSVGAGHNCAIKENDKVVCWGADDANQVSDTPDDKFRSVDVATY